jgi:hypothetical protein
MNLNDELDFCLLFEKKMYAYQLILSIKGHLTESGFQEFIKLEKWIVDNVDKYLTITGK